METGKVKILRYDPEIDKSPHYETYTYPFEKGMFKGFLSFLTAFLRDSYPF